jgi:acyl-CoA synthetase (AMP-forming)/AMP-acid ligase II
MSHLPDIIRRAGVAFGPRVAVVDGDRQLTFRQVEDRSRRLANVLCSVAHGDGARVAILMKNRLEYVEADLACARAGLVKVPVNPRLSDDERRYIIEDSDASVVLTESDELDRVTQLLPDSSVTTISVGGGTGTLDYEDALRGASSHQTLIAPDAERLSLILYTSGTTGRPKGAMLLDRCRIAGTTMMLAEEYAVGPDDGIVHAGPLSHGSGSKVVTFYARGARNIVMPRFDPAELHRIVRERGGTTTFLVPTMLQMLVESGERLTGGEGWGLRNITYGGASMPRDVLTSSLDAFGPILTQIYGSSEAPHPVTVLRHRDEADPYLRGREIVPAGWPVIGVDVQLVTPDGEPSEDVGELWVRGPNVMAGYWRQPKATAEAMVDGWYRTGDVARLEDDGMFTVVDRSKDIVITGGLNVYPAEVERVLRGMAGVRDAAVVGLPDPRWGEIVAAAIVRDGDGPADDVGQGSSAPPAQIVDAERVEEWCAAQLAGYKKPRRIVFVDELPKGSTGKVLKRDVPLLFGDR